MSDEYTGASVSYYLVRVQQPLAAGAPAYTAECQDIIEALGMDFCEGNAFKALWRRAAARNLGKAKRGYDNGLYDAQKVEFYGARLVARSAPVALPESNTPFGAPDADGWYEWNGDESMRPAGRVDYRCRNGDTGENVPAEAVRWSKLLQHSDVMKWKPSK